ncbi:MAG: hypothetical protein K2Z81_03940, partial [Cyanobacteria bacterium]|nr:hypothetical protein [Cyanobacteriota bacterium]
YAHEIALRETVKDEDQLEPLSYAYANLCLNFEALHKYKELKVALGSQIKLCESVKRDTPWRFATICGTRIDLARTYLLEHTQLSQAESLLQSNLDECKGLKESDLLYSIYGKTWLTMGQLCQQTNKKADSKYALEQALQWFNRIKNKSKTELLYVSQIKKLMNV